MFTPSQHREIKSRLAAVGATLVDVSRWSGVGYDRLLSILGGQRRPREEELEKILSAVDSIAPRQEHARA